MPTELDKELREAALEIINEVGRNMDFTIPLANAYDPATGAGTEAICTTYTVKVSPPIDYAQRYVDGASVQRGDARIFMAASGLPLTPVRDMVVKFDGITFKAVAVLPIYSGEQIAAFEVQLRK